MIKNIILVGLGGFGGSVLRYLTYLLIDKRFISTFPYSTLAVNVLGSFILGFIFGISLKSTAISQELRLFLAVGFCGSYTTFSAFSYDNLGLFQQKEISLAMLYVFISLAAGFGLVFVGFLIGKNI